MTKATILADSITELGYRITTFEVCFPDIIHKEVLKHRAFSSNTSSARAIRFASMVDSIRENPFIPRAFQKAHKGMQGKEYITDPEEILKCENQWLKAYRKAEEEALALHYMGVSKQITNRILTPYMWTKMIITTTMRGLDNFFELRCPSYTYDNTTGKSKKELLSKIKDESIKNFLLTLNDVEWLKLSTSPAEIHIQELGEKMYDAFKESKPTLLKENQWHIPFKDEILKSLGSDSENLSQIDLVQIASAQCARTSYTTISKNNKINIEKDLDLCERLIRDKHYSTFEHCAIPMDEVERIKFKKGFYPEETCYCKNLEGFTSYRYIIDKEM